MEDPSELPERRFNRCGQHRRPELVFSAPEALIGQLFDEEGTSKERDGKAYLKPTPEKAIRPLRASSPMLERSAPTSTSCASCDSKESSHWIVSKEKVEDKRRM